MEAWQKARELAWGSGVPRIFRETKESGFPEPSIMELGLRVRFVFPLDKVIRIRESTQSGVQSEAPVELSGTETKILRWLSDSPKGTKQLLTLLGYKQKTGNFKASMEHLLTEQLIEHTIPEKPNSRLQKYRLTEKGRQILREREVG